MRTPDLIAIVYFAYVIAAAASCRVGRRTAACAWRAWRRAPSSSCCSAGRSCRPFRRARLAAGGVAGARVLAARRAAARADAGSGSVAAGERPVDSGDAVGADAAGVAVGGAGTRLFPGPRLRPRGIPRPGARRTGRLGALLDARSPRRLRLLRHAAVAPGAAAAARRNRRMPGATPERKQCRRRGRCADGTSGCSIWSA